MTSPFTHYQFPGSDQLLCGGDGRQDVACERTTRIPSQATCPACIEHLAMLEFTDSTPVIDVTSPQAVKVRRALTARFGRAVPVTDAMVASELLNGEGPA